MVNAKVVDIVIHEHTEALAASLVDICDSVEDRRLLINGISLVADRVSDSIVEEIHCTMDDTQLVEK